MYFEAHTIDNNQKLDGQSRKRQNPIKVSITLTASNLTGSTLKFLCKASPNDDDGAAILEKESAPIAASPTGGDFQLTLVGNKATGQMTITSAETEGLIAPMQLTYAFQWKNSGGTEVEETESGVFTLIPDVIRNA